MSYIELTEKSLEIGKWYAENPLTEEEEIILIMAVREKCTMQSGTLEIIMYANKWGETVNISYLLKHTSLSKRGLYHRIKKLKDHGFIDDNFKVIKEPQKTWRD